MAFSSDSAYDLLENSFRQDRLAHAYLITGAAGSGVRELTVRLINLVNGAAYPDLESATGEHVQVVGPESKSRRIRVENMRSLERRMHLAAPGGVVKVGVVVDADRMMPEAANAFLKTLEEPPRQSLLLLLSAHPEQLLDTILSRCIQIPLYSRDRVQATESERALLELLDQHFRSGHRGLAGSWSLVQGFQKILRAEKTAISKQFEEEFKAESSTYQKTTEGDWLKRREEYYKSLTEARYIQKRNALMQILVDWFGDALRQQRGSRHLDLADVDAATAHTAKVLKQDEILRRLDALEEMRANLNTNVQETLALEAGFLAAYG